MNFAEIGKFLSTNGMMAIAEIISQTRLHSIRRHSLQVLPFLAEIAIQLAIEKSLLRVWH